MIVAIDRVDKNSLPVGRYCGAKASFAAVVAFDQVQAYRSHNRWETMMRLRPLLLILGALILVSGTARAVDHGQFENVQDDIRAWFKGVRSPSGVPCCDISDGHRTEYDVREGAYWVPINGLWWRGTEKASIRNPGNTLGGVAALCVI